MFADLRLGTLSADQVFEFIAKRFFSGRMTFLWRTLGSADRNPQAGNQVGSMDRMPPDSGSREGKAQEIDLPPVLQQTDSAMKDQVQDKAQAPKEIGQQRTWAATVSGAVAHREGLALRFVEPVWLDDKVMVDPPLEVSDLGLSSWQFCLVGHILDAKLPS